MEAVHTDRAFHVRQLPPEEWDAKLAGTPLAGHRMRPENALIIVVEDDEGQVIACWSAIDTVHVEGLWIQAGHRGRATVARTLLEGMLKVLHDLGVTEVMTNADAPEIETLLRHVNAQQLPGTSWLWRF